MARNISSPGSGNFTSSQPGTHQPTFTHRPNLDGSVNPNMSDIKDNFLLPSPDSGYDADANGKQTVRSRILSSQIYRQAYNLFINLEDKTWAQRLLAIVDSASQSPTSIFDEIGLSNKADKANEEAYQNAINQIGALIAEYQQFHNSLPSTQKQQYADAGINAALDPSLLSGSSINQRTPNPSSLAGSQIGDTSEDIGKLLQFAGSLSGGISGIVSQGLSVYKALSEIDIQNRYLSLTEAQAGAPISTPFKGKQNRENLFISYGNRRSARGREDVARLDRSLAEQERAQIEKNEAYMDLQVNSKMFEHFNEDVNEVVKDLGKLSYENWKSQFELKSIQIKRDQSRADKEKEVLDNLNPALEASSINSQNLFGLEENRVRNNLRSSYEKVISRMAARAERGSWVDSLMLMNLYNQGNLGIQDALETAAGVAGKFLNPVHKTKIVK